MFSGLTDGGGGANADVGVVQYAVGPPATLVLLTITRRELRETGGPVPPSAKTALPEVAVVLESPSS